MGESAEKQKRDSVGQEAERSRLAEIDREAETRLSRMEEHIYMCVRFYVQEHIYNLACISEKRYGREKRERRTVREWEEEGTENAKQRTELEQECNWEEQRKIMERGRTEKERETDRKRKTRNITGFLVNKAETLIKVSDNDLVYTTSWIRFTHFIHCAGRFVLLLYSHSWTFVPEICKLWNLFWSVYSTHSEIYWPECTWFLSLIWDFFHVNRV